MKVQLFAGLKDMLGSEVEVGVPADVKTLLQELVTNNPEVKELLLSSRVVVNQTIITENKQLDNGDVVVILPPSSGG